MFQIEEAKKEEFNKNNDYISRVSFKNLFASAQLRSLS